MTSIDTRHQSMGCCREISKTQDARRKGTSQAACSHVTSHVTYISSLCARHKCTHLKPNSHRRPSTSLTHLSSPLSLDTNGSSLHSIGLDHRLWHLRLSPVLLVIHIDAVICQQTSNLHLRTEQHTRILWVPQSPFLPPSSTMDPPAWTRR